MEQVPYLQLKTGLCFYIFHHCTRQFVWLRVLSYLRLTTFAENQIAETDEQINQMRTSLKLSWALHYGYTWQFLFKNQSYLQQSSSISRNLKLNDTSHAYFQPSNIFKIETMLWLLKLKLKLQFLNKKYQKWPFCIKKEETVA